MAELASRYTDTQRIDFMEKRLGSRNLRKSCDSWMGSQAIAGAPAAGKSTATGTRKKTRAKVRRTQTAGATG